AWIFLDPHAQLKPETATAALSSPSSVVLILSTLVVGEAVVPDPPSDPVGGCRFWKVTVPPQADSSRGELMRTCLPAKPGPALTWITACTSVCPVSTRGFGLTVILSFDD